MKSTAYRPQPGSAFRKALKGNVCPEFILELVDGRAVALFHEDGPYCSAYDSLHDLTVDLSPPSVTPAILRVAITSSPHSVLALTREELAQIQRAAERDVDGPSPRWQSSSDEASP